jgi:hypothetical protein
MVSYDPKVTAFANAMGYPTPQNIETTTAERLFDSFQAFMRDRDRTVEMVKRKRDEFSILARENIDVLVSCVGT